MRDSGSLESTGGFLPPCSKVLGAQLGMQHVLPHAPAATVPHLQPPRAGWGAAPVGLLSPREGERAAKNNPWVSSSPLWLPVI